VDWLKAEKVSGEQPILLILVPKRAVPIVCFRQNGIKFSKGFYFTGDSSLFCVNFTLKQKFAGKSFHFPFSDRLPAWRKEGFSPLFSLKSMSV
jgi:hypothetical protein